jgi:nucleotide-binding universal stress UspA family protein
MAIRCIICGITGSESSEKAVAAAAEMAKDHAARLTFVYVVDTRFLQGLTIQLRPEFAEDFLSRLGGKILEEAVGIAQSKGVTAKKALRKGKVLNEVIKVIKEEGADYLVVSDEGRTFAEKMLFGDRLPDNIKELEKRAGVPVKVVR